MVQVCLYPKCDNTAKNRREARSHIRLKHGVRHGIGDYHEYWEV